MFKYIIFDDHTPVLFPAMLCYRDVVDALSLPGIGDITSAGFCERNPEGKIICHGFAVSLNVGSKEDDADVIASYFDGLGNYGL